MNKQAKNDQAKNNAVLFVLTSHSEKGNTGEKTGAYLPEVAHPHEVFKKAGYEVDFVTPKGGMPPFDGVDRKDEVSAAFLDDASIQDKLARAPRPEDVDASKYVAVFYAGGHGTMWDFPDDAGLQKVAASIYEGGGVVGAVCHGPAGLVNIKLSSGKHLVDGKEVAAFTNDEERAVKLEGVVPFLLATELEQRGAKHRPGPMWKSQVVVDGRLVTGQNPASATGVGEAMVKVLAESTARA
ncbi:MAG: type 1 glutamine amidotransferase domain-containing protein [Polyangiaceae bacterium]|nr:type 1 glutamine amidotransferase domain-containing protein [Polyangiaceae bacterium]